MSGVSQDCVWVGGINGTKSRAGEPSLDFVPRFKVIERAWQTPGSIVG